MRTRRILAALAITFSSFTAGALVIPAPVQAHGTYFGRYNRKPFHCTNLAGTKCAWGHYHSSYGRCRTVIEPLNIGEYVYGGYLGSFYDC